jgi:hypothetical protein
MAAVAKLLRLLCVLERATGAGCKWRWTSAVRLMGVESWGRREKRAVDLKGAEANKS